MSIPLVIIAFVVPLLLVFHVIVVLHNRGYKIQRIDHKNFTKHTGA